MKISTRFFKSDDGRYEQETSNAPETFNGLRQVIFTARDNAKPTAENMAALTNVPAWMHTQKLWVSFAGFVFLGFATVERVALMSHLKPFERLIIGFIILILGGGVEVAFYRLSKELPKMYDRQRIISQRVILAAVVIMWLGLVTTVLMMMQVVPDWMLTVYVFAQMGGIGFYLAIDYCVRSLNPDRIDAEEAFTNYDRIRNIPHRLVSELALSLHYFVQNNAEQLANASFEEDLKRQVKGDIVTVGLSELDTILIENNRLKKQLQQKVTVAKPVTIATEPPITKIVTEQSVTNDVALCNSCYKNVATRTKIDGKMTECNACYTAKRRQAPKNSDMPISPSRVGDFSDIFVTPTHTGDTLPT